MNWERRSKILFLSSAFTTAFIVAEMIIYVCRYLFGKPAGLNVIEQCSGWLTSNGYGWLVPALDALVLYTLAAALWHVVRQLQLSRQAARHFAGWINEERTVSLNRTYCGGRREVLVVDREDAIALTMGFFRPQIVLSTGLLDMLQEEEAAAVIQHEIYHKRNRDPMKTAFMHICSAVFWYIPILRWCCSQYRIARELLADAYAIRNTGSAIGIGSALLKLMRHNQIRKYTFTYASFAETSINYRLQQMLEPEFDSFPKLPIKAAMVSIHSAAVVSAMLLAELL